MANLEDLQKKVDSLQESLNTEQQQVQDALSKLQKSVEELNGIVAGGGTEEQRQRLADQIDAIASDLAATIPDSTMPPTQE